MLSKIAKLLLPVAVVAVAQAQDLTDEQRAEIEARIAPVGDVCLQGENCGGLPQASTPMAASAAAGGAAAGATQVAAAGAIDGQAVYNQACLACHASGVGGAPVVGDAGSWEPRIAKGIDALYASGINGIAGTAMMAKGGMASLSDDDVKAAVDFMVGSSQ